MSSVSNEQSLAQIARFGVVGLLATALHAGAYWWLVHNLWLTPVPANVAAFACAFTLSFLGHRHWTFAAQAEGTDERSSLVKFLLTALLGLCSNTFITWLLTGPLGLPANSALVGILFVTPVLTFVCSKYWAFARD
jgi:putative flippase GtrA